MWSNAILKRCFITNKIKRDGICIICGNDNITHIKECKEHIECFCSKCATTNKDTIRIYDYITKKT